MACYQINAFTEASDMSSSRTVVRLSLKRGTLMRSE